MRQTFRIATLLMVLSTLSGCVGGGYAFSDTYRGTIYEEPVVVARHYHRPVVVRSAPYRTYRPYRGRGHRYHGRFVRHHRAVGFRY